MVNVSFKVQYKCAFGQSLAVVGDAVSLGKWYAGRGQRMQWSGGDNWSCNVMLPAGSSVECKYVIVDDKGNDVRWQEGTNMALKVPANYRGKPVQGYDVRVSWCKTVSSFSTHPQPTPVAAAAPAADRASTDSTSTTASNAIAGVQGKGANSARPNPVAIAHATEVEWHIVAASVTAQPSAPADLLPHVPSPIRSNVATLVQAAASAVLNANAPADAAGAAAPHVPGATASEGDAATPAVVPSFQMSPASNDEPMSITLKSRRAHSPSVKISLSSSFSKLMEMPSLARASGSTTSNGCSTTAAAAGPVANKATAPALRSHPIDIGTEPSNSSPASTSDNNTNANAPVNTAFRAASNALPASDPSPADPTWGLEYDVYAAAYGMPYIHTPFDLEAYAMFDQARDDQVAAGLSSTDRRVDLGPLLSNSMARGGDFLESAVQAARSGSPTSPDGLLSPNLLAATAASTALAMDAVHITATAPIPTAMGTPAAALATAAAAVEPPLDMYRLVSRSSPAVSDWAGRTLVEMSSGRPVVDEDSDEDETADEDAAMAMALGAPVAPADMAALLNQLGTALGRSVRMRYDGTDATAQDLLELDRKIALATSKLYRQRDGLLTGWVKKETRRQLAAVMATPASRPASNSVTPM